MSDTAGEDEDLNQEEKKEIDNKTMCAQDKTVEVAEGDAGEAPVKTKIIDWPLRDISDPHPNDVLYGRGGGTNHHPGNKLYRKMVEDRKLDYIHSKRLDKPLVALEIIRTWRAQDPPGRFLKVDDKTGKWNDVGDKKAREKTSQALREKAPVLRKEEEQLLQGSGDEEEEHIDDDEGSEEKVTKSTRFAEGTNTEGTNNKDTQRPILARDHSLGREYMEAGQDVTLDGFSWQEPFQGGRSSSERMSSQSSVGLPPEQGPPMHHQQQQQQQPYLPGPPPQGYSHSRAGSHSSMGSMGMPPQQGHYRYPSHGSVGPPPPPPAGYRPQHMSSEDRQMQFSSSGRYESWGPVPGGPQMGPPSYGYPPQHSGSWSQRENSLGQNPLSHASVSQSAPYPFDGRNGSGHWGHQPPPHSYPPMDGPPGYQVSYPPPPGVLQPPHQYQDGPERQYSNNHGPPPPPPHYQGGPDRQYSASGGPPPPPPRHDHRVSCPPSPPYEVDPSVAQTWSGKGVNEIAKTWSGEEYDRYRTEHSVTSPRQHERKEMAELPKPDMVKRMTSNQNETLETKRDLVGPSVKRAALNRDNSMASNRLKEQYLPAYRKGSFNTEHEMRQLSSNMEQSSLAHRPKPLSSEERMTTIDLFAMDLMVKPRSLTGTSRSSTIEALDLDLEDDPVLRPFPVERSTTMEDVFADLKERLPRPSALSATDRLTTTDFLAIVNEPIPEY